MQSIERHCRPVGQQVVLSPESDQAQHWGSHQLRGLDFEVDHHFESDGMVAWVRFAACEFAGEPGTRSWAGGYYSFLAARAVSGVGSLDYGGQGATSSCLAVKSWAVGDVAHVAHTGRGSLVVALTDTVVEVDSTWNGAGAETAVGRICFCVGHVEKVMLPTQVSWTAVCGMT